MSRYTYYKILVYRDCLLKSISEKEIDNYSDSLETATKRCNYWHQKKLLHNQLVIVKISKRKNEIAATINPPLVFAVLSPSKRKFKEWVSHKKSINKNFCCLHIMKYGDLKDYAFDYYKTLSDWKEIVEHERILSEIKCRCRSEEIALAAQDDYNKLVDSEYR